MSGFAHDCPHCGTASAGFLIVSNYPNKNSEKIWGAIAECGVCKEFALASLFDNELGMSTSSVVPPLDFGRKLNLSDRFQVFSFEPKAAESRIADNIPENVESAMTEAEKSFQLSLFGAAAACYRKAIERAVKHLHPEGKGMLNARIREIEKKGLMPEAMIGLLDEVRVFGNATMHEEDYDPNKEDCTVAREFVHLFLTYGFSLPAMIASAKAKTQS